MKRAFTLLAAVVASTAALSASGHKVPMGTRAKGAQTVVVGTVIQVTSAFEQNEFGDRLIVSHVLLRVEEALKGQAPQVVALDVEGGTVGGVTLKVSDMDAVNTGERGVFFLTKSRSGVNVPHLRGNGIVKLDSNNRVKDDDGETLADVRQQVRGAQ